MSTYCDDRTVDPRHSGNYASATALRVASGLKKAVLWPLRVLEARRELEMLAGMSEYELKDIGLTRSDLGDATALPPDQSPTEFLAARVEERHHARSF